MFVTNFLIDHGVSRDSWWWFWGKVLSIATLITSGVIDLTYWATYVGLHPSVVQVHIVQVLAIVALWISGQYSTSGLYAKGTAEVMSTKSAPPAAAWLLPFLLVSSLGLIATTSTGCAGKVFHVAVAGDTALAKGLHQVLLDERRAYQTGLYAKDAHDGYLKTIRSIDQEAIALTDALTAWQNAGSDPKTLPTIVADAKTAIQQILNDLAALPPTNPFITDLTVVLGLLS